MRPAVSPQQQVLAFDFGAKRTGVATGSGLLGRGQALRTIVAQGEPRFDAIAALVGEWQPAVLVVGVPLHPDGAPHENTLRARRFARQLAGRFKLPVHEVDERYSTTEALSNGARDADAESAVILLEQFFRERVS
jgi:putative Holliday junction resolvase